MEFNSKEIKFTTAFIVDEKDAIDLNSHRINFVVSSSVIDRDCEIVEAQAVFDAIGRKGEFPANPVCLTSHRHKLEGGEVPSIGSWMTETARLKNKQVEMVLQFDIELKLGNEYWKAYKNKTMRAVSIGFRIKNYRVEEINGRQVYIVTELELLEISVCAVGANMQALSKMKELGFGFALEKQALTLDAHANYRIIEGYKTVIDGVEVNVVTKMELAGVTSDFTSLKEYIKDQLEEQFDRLKYCLRDNPGGSGDLPLGDDLIPPAEGAKAEEILKIFADMVQQKLKGK